MSRKPLVSVCIPNYNYGHYLRNCLDSVLAQTYDNFEVIFRDNASTDDSYEIALSYIPRFRERGIFLSVSQNKYNFGSDRNSNLCGQFCEGELIVVLASDDAWYPEFLEQCVDVFEKNPSVSMVMVHRDEIDEKGNVYHTLPFYNTSCVIPSEDQAAVFMMSGIAIPGQRMTRTRSKQQIRQWVCSFQVANDWYYNALYACVGDIGYIKEPLMQYRVHFGNETNESEENLTAIMEHYQIIHKIAKVTSEYGMTKPAARLDEATRKLGGMALRYALKMIKAGHVETAQRYLNLSLVFDPMLEASPERRALLECVNMPPECRADKAKEIENLYVMQRRVSYDPPKGYRPI